MKLSTVRRSAAFLNATHTKRTEFVRDEKNLLVRMDGGRGWTLVKFEAEGKCPVVKEFSTRTEAARCYETFLALALGAGWEKTLTMCKCNPVQVATRSNGTSYCASCLKELDKV